MSPSTAFVIHAVGLAVVIASGVFVNGVGVWLISGGCLLLSGFGFGLTLMDWAHRRKAE